MPDIGRTQAEIELTRKLSKTLVQREVIEPMAAAGWGHGTPPSPAQTALMIADRARADGATEEQIAGFLEERGVKYTPPAGGQPAKTEGAPAPAAPAATATGGQPDPTKTTPAPAAQVAKTDASATAPADQNVLTMFENLRDQNGLIMGKYKTVEDALKGAGHLANMAKQALARAEQAEARLSSVAKPVVADPPAARPAAAPTRKAFVPTSRPELMAARERLDKVLSKTTNDGFDGESAREFAEATREVARQEALSVADEVRQRQEYDARAEEDRFSEVNSYMAEKYPDSQNLDPDEFRLFLNLNPLLTEAMTALRAQGRDTRAAELGYTEFLKSRTGTQTVPGMSSAEAERKEADLAAREQVRKELRDEALKDAGIVKGSAGGASAVETPGVTGPSQDDINAMANAMKREGEHPGSAAATQWRRAVIGRFLPPELFGGR